MVNSTNKYYLKNRNKILSKLKCKICKKRVNRHYMKKHQKTEICRKTYCMRNHILYFDKIKGVYWRDNKIVKNPFILDFD